MLSGHIDFVPTYNDIMSIHHILLAGQKGCTCTHLCGHFNEITENSQWLGAILNPGQIAIYKKGGGVNFLDLNFWCKDSITPSGPVANLHVFKLTE